MEPSNQRPPSPVPPGPVTPAAVEGDQLLALFTQALELSGPARDTFLANTGISHPALRSRLEELLAQHAAAGTFLEAPLAATITRLRQPVIGEQPGDQIGNYKLVRQLGEGGWGVVYLAEQQAPVQRQVALKILKPGMDTRSIIARFEAERQTLALMDHPNIAKVFDAGATTSGRPYFVMELIRGRKITDYCDAQHLSLAERLRLFRCVCEAVQHAHQKGIIHRDIKPSNILVTTTPDREALPVIIDFGIAKALTGRPTTGDTVHTNQESMIGTPAYMSPEQTINQSRDLDTRTDIYSLGVLLYELLAGTTPFDAGLLATSSPAELRHILCEQDPRPPSQRLRQYEAGQLLAVARARQADPVRLPRLVQGDLDCIVMKALDKDRCRRYETALGLSLDIGRYLADEAISARPPSALYRFQKTVRRHRLLFAATCILTFILIGSLILITASLAAERRAHHNAALEADKSREVTRFLEDMLQGAGPSYALGRDTTMLREILDQTAGELNGRLADQPEVAAQLCSIVGHLYVDIGRYEQAENIFRAALAINQRVTGTQSLATAQTQNDLGGALAKQRKNAEAQIQVEQALAQERQLLPPNDPLLAEALGNLSDILRHEGKTAAAEKAASEALQIRQQHFGPGSLEAANSLRSLCIIRGDQGQWTEAEALGRAVLKTRQEKLGPAHPLIAGALKDVAWTLHGQGRENEAEILESEALVMQQKLLGAEHPDVASSYYLLGERLARRREFIQAASLLQTALAIQQKVLGPTNTATLETMHSLSHAWEETGNWAGAENLRRQAVVAWQNRQEEYGPAALEEMAALVQNIISQGRFAEAGELLTGLLTPEFTPQPASSPFFNLRAELAARQNQWPAAATAALQAFQRQPQNPVNYAMEAACLLQAGRWAEYDQVRHEMLQAQARTDNPYVADQTAKACLFRPLTGEALQTAAKLAQISLAQGARDDGAEPFFQLCQALAEYRLGRFESAASWSQKAYATPRPEARQHAAALLALAYWQLGQTNLARQFLAEGENLAPTSMPADISTSPGEQWRGWLFARVQLNEAEALIPAESTATSP